MREGTKSIRQKAIENPKLVSGFEAVAAVYVNLCVNFIVIDIDDAVTEVIGVNVYGRRIFANLEGYRRGNILQDVAILACIDHVVMPAKYGDLMPALLQQSGNALAAVERIDPVHAAIVEANNRVMDEQYDFQGSVYLLLEPFILFRAYAR